MLRPARLIPSGVQGYHRETIATSNDAFAYCSTMALHIFRLKDNTLQKVIAAHERPISAICWCPEDPQLLASCSIGMRMAIWDIENEEEKTALKVSEVPTMMDWAFGLEKIAVATSNGSINFWDYKANKTNRIFSVAEKSCKVLRFHPRNAQKLLCGLEDGSLTVYNSQQQKKVHIVGKSKTSKDAVTDAQWDPLSEDYLLVSFADGSLTLFDVSRQAELHSFDKQAQAIRSLAWAKAQPGNFVSATDRVGLLKLWNVSQRTPLGQIKVGNTGVLCVKAVPSEPNWFVLSFKNSAVGVCDIAARTMRFMSSPGHSETIFDVAFHPKDQDLIGTASYDGYVKLWRISTHESVREMYAGKEQLLYGLAFGPGATKVCCVSGSGMLFIFKVDTGETLVKQQVHTGQGFRCEWNQRGPCYIATGGNDGYACVVNEKDGSVVSRLTHPSAVFGVAWHPMQEGILATGCQDSMVRIFSLGGPVNPTAPDVILQGHDARVFNVAFHPILPSIICSGSDDRTIRIWNWTPGFRGQRQLKRLVGHTSYVRGLLWHTELPHILFSGSWDSTIRVWDAVESRCLYTAYEHHADVYGLAMHPERPFFLVSSSRDTTIRFWIFEDLVRPMLVSVLLRPDQMLEMLGGSIEEAMALFSTEGAKSIKKLYGKASHTLATELTLPAAQTRPVPIQVYQKILTFFLYRQGLEDFWGLIANIRGEMLPGGMNTHRGFFHERELIACQKSKALELASGRSKIGIGSKQEERLQRAAQIMLRVGDLRSYCRFMAQAGHWERAICIAPAVSLKFWQELSSEYVETLSAEADIQEAAPFLLSTGRSSALVDAFIGRGDLDHAFVVAKAECDQLLPTQLSGSSQPPAPKPPPSDDARAKLEDVASVLARRHAEMGEPLLAAMCHLAVSKSTRALSFLSRAHEVVLAYVLADLLELPKDPLLLKFLAMSAEHDELYDVAAEYLLQHPQGPDIHIPLLAARHGYPESLRNYVSISRPEQQDRAAQCQAEGRTAEAILAYACARQGEQAVRLATDALMQLFQSPEGWTLAEARRLLDPLESLPIQDLGVKEIASTLACASFVGLVEASQLGYHELMFPLAQTLRNIITHQNLNFPVSLFEITMLEATCTSHRAPAAAHSQLTSLLGNPDLPSHLRLACERQAAALERRSPADEWAANDGPGLLKLAGSHLPSCYKKYAKTSVLTNQLIRGPAFELEDKRNFVSLADALAWVRVNAFSPLNTGCKINPI